MVIAERVDYEMVIMMTKIEKTSESVKKKLKSFTTNKLLT